MNSITQGMLSAGCEVRVLSMCSDKHPVQRERMGEEYLQKTRFEAVHVDLNIHMLDAAVAWLCGESYHVKRFISRDFSDKLRQVLQEEAFDVVHVESIFLTPYVPLIRKHSNAKVVLRAHNVEHKIWQRIEKSERNPFKRRYLRHLALTLGAYEREHVNDYDGVVSITENDAQFFREHGRKPVISIPFGVIPEQLDNVAPESNSLFHIGSMDWRPNQEGIDWFLENVWPLVHERMPQLTFYLAGRKMPKELLQLQQPGVKVIGEVSDASYFINSKLINIVPLLSGSGIRVKIIEAMAAGKTVIATTIGAEGIEYTNGKDILIADTPQQFVEQVERCISDPEFCSQVGHNAYDLIVNHYSTERLTEKIIGFYQTINS